MTFNATLGLGLQTQQKTTPFKSTAFVINYSFISGFNYEIKITALGNSDVLLKTSAVPNVTNFVTASQTACGVDANAFNYSTAGYGQYSTAVTTTSTVYNIPAFSIPSGNSAQYLYIWSSGGVPSRDLDVLNISKITITATPIVSFNLTSSFPSITCGSTTPIAFTVTNGGNTPGITGYTWNLGSASNGWLYNGSAAPATITTGATVNTITLTPACGSSLSNVSATVTANSVNYTTNAASVAVTPTNVAIGGNPNACTSENYFISGLPCNATVSWGIAPPTGIASIFPLTGPSTTVTKVANGNITLTATIQSSCGAFSLSRQISVGTPVPPGINGPDHDLCYNGRNSEKAWFYVANPVSSLTYSWQIDGLVAGSGTSINVDAFRWEVGTHQIRVRSYSSACGYSAWFTSSFIVIDCSSNRFTVSPNPSSENISVSANNSGQNISKQVEVQEVELVDKMGSTRYKRKLGKGLTSTNISVSNLPSDIYTLRIFDGEVWHSYKVSIQH